ncbi:Uma2 family endonuclease [Armatimonas rosea]|uniref:Uma2 family endonuclease n=1 Tax=Armatimonas rosea TaxID=685828 RepID=A0A7W9SP03_ARMRO|nr:Uma2 family endonuclease [Armatimonas rosea]MBB6049508.1 Uma2 family endonuclease [Armatimonas rosea]
MAGQKVPLLQPDEYLAWEKTQKEKHEYISGEILAMAGASYPHNVLVAEAVRLLGNALAASACVTLSSDQRVRIREAGPFFYPDVSVACEPFLDDESCLRNPVVIIEVLSDSTDHYDRGEKWSHYRQLPSLRHYVLLSQKETLAEHYSRASGEQAIWQFVELRGPEALLDLVALDTQLPLGALYRRLE